MKDLALEIERAIMQEKLGLERKLKDNIRPKPMHLPVDPRYNWTYKGRKLKPIYLPGQR